MDFAYILSRAVAQGLPLLFGSNGEILNEKSGNLNLGIPGIMVSGGVAGIAGALIYENSVAEPNGLVGLLVSLLCSVGCSLLLSLIYCFLTVTLRANQNVTGLALTIFGSGFGNFFGGAMSTILGISNTAIPATAAAYKTPLVPFYDKLGAIGTIFFSHGCMFYIALAIAFVSWFILKKTRVGLSLRAVGENPATADAAGINVTRYKYVATCLGGIIAGLGGLYYAVDYSNGLWDTQSFGDRGWLAVALVIFVVWKPNLAVLGAFLFGGLYIAEIFVPGLTSATKEIFKMLPYVVTIVILISTSLMKKKENQPPASLGLPYFREER